MNTATIKVVIDAVEYFINSEIAFLELKKCVGDAKKRNRQDLLRGFTSLMSEVVSIVQYKDLLTNPDE